MRSFISNHDDYFAIWGWTEQCAHEFSLLLFTMILKYWNPFLLLWNELVYRYSYQFKNSAVSYHLMFDDFTTWDRTAQCVYYIIAYHDSNWVEILFAENIPTLFRNNAVSYQLMVDDCIFCNFSNDWTEQFIISSGIPAVRRIRSL